MKKNIIPTKQESLIFKDEFCKLLDNENNPQVKNPNLKNDINAVIQKNKKKTKN